MRAGAVVIAAGGFVMNPEMVHTFAPELEALLERGMALGNTYDDGLGIRLGESVGGVAEHMDRSFLTAPFYPPAEMLLGICVNNRGERFVAEDSYHSRTSAFVFDQPEQKAWLILDSAHMAEPAYGFQPLVDGWETVAEMEAGLGVPEGSLARTLEEYNAAAREGDDPDVPQGRGVPHAARLAAVRRLRPDPRSVLLLGVHLRRPAGRSRRPGAAGGPLRRRGSLRRGCLRLEHRGRRQGATHRAPSSAKRRFSAVVPGVMQPRSAADVTKATQTRSHTEVAR